MEHGFTWLGWMSDSITHHNMHIFGALIVVMALCALALCYKSITKSIELELIPDEKISAKNIIQVSVEAIYSMIKDIIGPNCDKYLPLMGTLFIYIFVSNLMGVIPGFLPPTDNINTNLAMGATIFIYYNYVGIKEHGIKNYLKHFMGPVWWIAPLLFSIELISHFVRPLTLSIRLFGNISGDHIVLGIFSDMVPLLVPVIFMAFGVFVAFVQAFVFTLLSSVYIGLATAHEEH